MEDALQLFARGSTFNDVGGDQHNIHIVINNQYVRSSRDHDEFYTDPNIMPGADPNVANWRRRLITYLTLYVVCR